MLELKEMVVAKKRKKQSRIDEVRRERNNRVVVLVDPRTERDVVTLLRKGKREASWRKEQRRGIGSKRESE